jgi:hypothetical protein
MEYRLLGGVASMMKHGFSRADWNAAKEEARALMVERAKVRGMISYSDRVQQIRTNRVEAQDPRLFHMLDEILSEEDAAGRGMLTVIVVHKLGDMQPGPGFFELAKQLGRNTRDIDKCWIDEPHRVHAVSSLNNADDQAPS